MTSPRPCILITDDDALTLSAEIRLLTSNGYDVFSASNGEDTLKQVGRQRPDLMLLDVNLPDMPGFEVCRRVRKDPRNAGIFIVLLSGAHNSGEQQAEGYRGGADAYIIRPIPSRELLARIQAYLRLKMAEGALRESEERFRLLADSAPILIWSALPDGSRDYFNRYWLEFTGRTAEQELGNGWMESLHPEDRPRVLAANMDALGARNEFRFEYRLRRPDGEYGWVLETAAPRFTESGDFIGYLGSCVDLTENRQLHEQVISLKASIMTIESDLQSAVASGMQSAHTDVMTGVHNRRYLYEIAEHEIAVAQRYRQPLAITRFDLDNFKKVNEAFGHAVGDQVLQRICQAVRSEMRSADIFGRSGEDDFVILQPVTSARSARVLAERIRKSVESLAIPVPDGDQTVMLTVSIGIDELHQPGLDGQPESQLATGGDSVDELFQRAEQAMNLAKAAGRNRVMLNSRLR